MNPEQIKQYLAMGYTAAAIAQSLGITEAQVNAAAGAPAGLPPLAPPAQPGPQLPAPGGGAAALAAKLAGSQWGNADGRKPPDGRHVIDLDAVTYKDELQNGDCVIFEFVMVESTSPEAEIGGKYSKAYNVQEDRWGYNLANVKEWIGLWIEANVPGATPRVRWESAYLTNVIDPNTQPMKGSRWSVSTRTETAEKSGRSFTKYTDLQLLAPGTKLGLGQAPAGLPPLPGAPAGLPPLPGAPGPMPGWPTGQPFPGAK